MDSLQKPELIMTHESDLDGLVSGLLLQELSKQLFDANIPLNAYNHDAWQKRLFLEKSAWVCDLGYDNRLDKPDWTIIDHHAFTGPPPKAAKLIHHLQKSSSLLCYELCQKAGLGSPKLERLVHLSNVADLFLLNDPEFLLAMDYANLVKTYQFWNVRALIGGDLEKLLDHPLLEVMSVKRRVEDPIGYQWARKNVVSLTPTVGYVDVVLGNSNMIVNQLLQEHATPYAVLITITRKGNGHVFLSLRSLNGEALKVAERLHGGGHPNASGATLPRSITTISSAVDYLKSVLAPRVDMNASFNSLENAFAAIELKP